VSDNPSSEVGGPHELRDYALIADGERGALVGPTGELAWMCFPGWDGDAVFAELIGGAGHYGVAPQDRFVWGGYYEEGTLIWRSRWVTTSGIVECREALCFPGDAGRAVILRRIQGIEGGGRLDVVLRPRAGFGAEPLRNPRRHEGGTWTARTGDLHVRWCGAPRATDRPDGHGGRELFATLAWTPDTRHDLVLELSDRPFDGEPPDPERLWSGTRAAWGRELPAFADVVGRRDVRHAYCVLRGLSSDSGATVAAATTSLPERARQGRSFDYRFAWIRDQCYIGQAAAAGQAWPLLDGSVRFVGERLLGDGPSLMPAYTVGGGRVPDERSLSLPGYPGGTDMVGNHVNRQFQLDAFGESLLLFASAARADRLDADGWRAAEVAADAIAARWEEPDAGVWELEPRRWTHSRLTCVAGLRAMAGAGAPPSVIGAWTALAERILADTAATCIHPSGRWQRSPEDERVDAALLMAGIRGAVPPHDPRTTATLVAVVDELTRDGYAYRYRPDERPLGKAEGAFLLCGFMLSLAHLQEGNEVEAVRWFERNRAACGPAGLLAEEFDVEERQLRGNLPQAFVHAMLMESAFRQSGVTPAI